MRCGSSFRLIHRRRFPRNRRKMLTDNAIHALGTSLSSGQRKKAGCELARAARHGRGRSGRPPVRGNRDADGLDETLFSEVAKVALYADRQRSRHGRGSPELAQPETLLQV
jgi:hypothetical protein